MLDRALQLTVKHLTTGFVIVALVAVPLHLVYNFAFRDVIALSDLHEDIEDFPEGRQVKGIDRARLAESRSYFVGLSVIELGFALLLVGAFARLLELDQQDRPASALDAYKHMGARPAGWGRPAPQGVVAVVGGLLVAVAIGILIALLGGMLVEPIPDQDRWAATAIVQATARSVAAPFVLVPLAAVLRSAKAPTDITPKLY